MFAAEALGNIIEKVVTWLLGGLLSLGIWKLKKDSEFRKTVFEKISSLREDMNAQALDTAKNYVTKEELNRLEDKLDDHATQTNNKLDKMYKVLVSMSKNNG